MDIPDILFLKANRVWRTYPGGKRLDEMEGRESPADSHFPEDWIGSTTRAVNRGREDRVDEGLSKVWIAGETLTLKALCERVPEAMLGKAHFDKYGANTQFLLKFLDSAIRLHIQCHPTIAFAREHLDSPSGKTEAYIILAIRDGVEEPYIYMGFQHPPEQQEFKRMIQEQDEKAILACFDKIPIKPGDVFMVPGGMPHAIGEGVFMIEIMEPTDFAVRIEFERGGYVLPEASRFMSRGIDFAVSMFNFSATPVETIKREYFCTPRLRESQNQSAEYVLIDENRTPCFRVHRICVNDCFMKKANSFYTGIVAKGSGSIRVNGKTWLAQEGTKFFVPNQTGEVMFETDGGMEIVATFPPN